MLISVKDAKEFLGVSPNTLRNWIAKGCPHEKVNGVYKFDPMAVTEWRTQQEEDGVKIKPAEGPPTAANRLAEAKASREELRLERERGVLVPRDGVREAVGDVFFALQKRLLALPDRLATELYGKDREAIATRIREELVLVMRDCAKNPYAG